MAITNFFRTLTAILLGNLLIGCQSVDSMVNIGGDPYAGQVVVFINNHCPEKLSIISSVHGGGCNGNPPEI